MLVLCKCGWEIEIAEGGPPRLCPVCQTLVSSPSSKKPEEMADTILSEAEPPTQYDEELAETVHDDDVVTDEEKPDRPKRKRRKPRPKQTWLSKFEGFQIPTPIDLAGSAFLFVLGGVIIAFRLANANKFSYLGLIILIFGFFRLFRIASLRKD